MAFDIGAGLHEMGKAVATTAGAYTLEAQKGELEKEKVILADQLAGVRDEKQRGFLTSEREATQGFTGGENEKNRTSAKDIATMSAGASIRSAEIHAASIEKQITAENNRATVLQPNADMTVSLVNKVTGKAQLLNGEDGKPIKVRDPDLAKAQYEAVREVANDKKEIRLKYQTDLSLAQSELNKLIGDPMAKMDPSLKAPIDAARKYIDEVTKKRDAELEPHNQRSQRLIESLSRNIDTGTTKQDLNKYMPQKAAPATNPATTPETDVGMINRYGGSP